MSSRDDDALKAARTRKAQAFKIFIYCDDPSHAPRRVPVANFLELPGGGWHEEPASHATPGPVGSGHLLIGDNLATEGWANDPDVANADVRGRFKLECRKCKRNGRAIPCDAKAETLYPVLDGWRSAGVLEVPLAVVAATLGVKPGN